MTDMLSQQLQIATRNGGKRLVLMIYSTARVEFFFVSYLYHCSLACPAHRLPRNTQCDNGEEHTEETVLVAVGYTVLMGT